MAEGACMAEGAGWASAPIVKADCKAERSKRDFIITRPFKPRDWGQDDNSPVGIGLQVSIPLFSSA